MLTLETDPPVMATDETQGRLSHMSDNIVLLGISERDGVMGRTLRIAKARGTAHDLQSRDLQIDGGGLRIGKAAG